MDKTKFTSILQGKPVGVSSTSRPLETKEKTNLKFPG